jgi:hypothetical protein
MCLPFLNLFVWYDALQYMSSNLRGLVCCLCWRCKCLKKMKLSYAVLSLRRWISHINFRMPEQTSLKLGIYMIEPEPF